MTIPIRILNKDKSELKFNYIKNTLNRKYHKYDFVKNVEIEIRRHNQDLICYLMNTYINNNTKPITIAYTTANERDAFRGAVKATQTQLKQKNKKHTKRTKRKI